MTNAADRRQAVTARWVAEREQLKSQLAAADKIVLLLAEQSAPVIDGTYANGHDWCTLCDGEGERQEDHDEDCPWRLAREYVAAGS